MHFSVNEFAVVQQEASVRLSDLRSFWSDVKTRESSPPLPQSFLFLSGTGFTVVYLYAVLEFSVNRAVKQLSELISNYSVRMGDVSPPMMCLVHDPKIKAIKDSGKGTKLRSRLSLFAQVRGKEPAVVHDELLSTELQNVWTKSIEETFEVFGISSSALSNPRNKSYIDKIVDDRNAVAHGRETPDRIGAHYTAGDVDEIIRVIEAEISYIIEQFSKFFNERKFVDSKFRAKYRKRDSVNT